MWHCVPEAHTHTCHACQWETFSDHHYPLLGLPEVGLGTTISQGRGVHRTPLLPRAGLRSGACHPFHSVGPLI